jgi:hypothetical protein
VDRYSFSVWLFHPQHLAGFNGALQAAQKDPKIQDAQKSTSGGAYLQYVAARRLRATKPMDFFQPVRRGAYGFRHMARNRWGDKAHL